MGVVGRAFGQRPVLHGVGDGIGNRHINRLACINRPTQGPVYVAGQGAAHYDVVEYVQAEMFGYVHNYLSFLSRFSCGR